MILYLEPERALFQFQEKHFDVLGKGSKTIDMPSRPRMRNDLERLKRRIQANKKSLRETRLRTERLKASIQIAIQAHQNQKEITVKRPC